MAKKSTRNTKGRIIEAAWQLFYRQGYDDTTVEEIIEESGTSRGSFYHYFEGKDALLSSVSYLFDQKYEQLMATIDPNMNRFDQLMYLNRELFVMIENSISLDLLARLYSSQLITRGEKHLLDHNRTYFKVLRRVSRSREMEFSIMANSSRFRYMSWSKRFMSGSMVSMSCSYFWSKR